MEPIRIVLADDHWLMRDGTRHILEQCPDLRVVGDAEDGQHALELIERLQPDVAILDIRMPKLNGIEVVRRMKEYSPNTEALMLTAYDDDDYILALMAAGALGYLLKTARPSELIDAVQRVHLGEPVLHPAIAMKVARLWARLRDSTRREFSEQLSPREREILQLAANGLRNKAIADKLSISIRTVEGHFNSIFAKLGVSSRIEAVLCAVSRHIVTLEEGDRTWAKHEAKLEVVDDGIGFSILSVSGDFTASGQQGLLSMQERAELLGDKLKIQSSPGEGTR